MRSTTFQATKVAETTIDGTPMSYRPYGADLSHQATIKVDIPESAKILNVSHHATPRGEVFITVLWE